MPVDETNVSDYPKQVPRVPRMTIEHGNVPTIEDLAFKIADRAIGRPIGDLQKHRARRKRFSRIRRLFDRSTIWDKYAYHVGGRSELQFNIGFETIYGEEVFRHGVAFALLPGPSLPNISILRERIDRFNRYLDDHPKAFNDLSMWYFDNDLRSPNFPPFPIPNTLIRPQLFIMVGSTCPTNAINVETVLDDFDRLLPLYEFVEGGDDASAKESRAAKKFVWAPGNTSRVSRDRFERPERQIERVLRHNDLQDALFSHLCDEHGNDNVSGEQDCGIGKPVDVAVRKGHEYTYYEIKTGYSPQSCIREAFGQLMEYSYWPGSQQACQLVVVGESPIDEEASDYLARLGKRFSLPLAYRQFDPVTNKLVD